MATKPTQAHFVDCLSCKWAELMQWYDNPVIAQCNKRNDRQVAATRKICKEYVARHTKADITHYDHYDNE